MQGTKWRISYRPGSTQLGLSRGTSEAGKRASTTQKMYSSKEGYFGSGRVSEFAASLDSLILRLRSFGWLGNLFLFITHYDVVHGRLGRDERGLLLFIQWQNATKKMFEHWELPKDVFGAFINNLSSGSSR